MKRARNEKKEGETKDSVVGWRSYELRRKWRDQQKRSEKEKNRARGAAGNVVILFGWGGVVGGSQQGI